MQWIFQLIVRHRNFSTLAFTVLLSIWMISSPPGRQASMVRTLSFSIFYPFQIVFSQTNRIKNIFAENKRLREDVVFLRTRVSLLSEAEQESDRLRNLLHFGKSLPFDLIPARVIATDPSFPSRSIVIDVGRNFNLTEYIPVITPDGIAGKAVQVLGKMTMVQLLLDPANQTSVMLPRSREIGILESENGRDFFIRFRTHSDVTIQDRVVTSGLGGIYPKGLMVGRVVKIEEGSDPLFKWALVRTSVDFDHLEEVFVMRLSPQWTAFHNDLDTLVFDK